MLYSIMSGAYLERYSFLEGVAKMARHGYRGVDYNAFIQTTTPFFTQEEEAFQKEIERQKDILESFHISPVQTHGPWRFPVCDGTVEDREERFMAMSKAIRGTAYLGSPYMIIHPIMPFGAESPEHPEIVYEINLEFMSRLVKEAEKNDVTICFENMPMPRMSMASPEVCLNFAKEINSPNFKICLDTGHCTMLNVKPGDAVRMLGKEWLQTLHVHDNNGQNDLHWIPYTGVIDWDDFQAALQEIGYDGCLSLETVVPKKFTGEMRELQERSLYLSACKLAGR